MALLEATDVVCAFSGFRAVDRVNFSLDAGERRGVIGPNGAGKSTFFNALTGVVKPTEGRVRLKQRDVTGWPVNRIARLGIARTFQAARMFPGRSVADHVMLAAGVTMGRGQGRTIVRDAKEALSVTEIAHLWGRNADRLTTAERKRVALAMCLARRPSILLLDEPAAGLDDTETRDFDHLLRIVHEQYGLTTVLIEHKLSFVMGFSERVTVLDAGRVIAEGEPTMVAKDPRVIEAYLGAAA